MKKLPTPEENPKGLHQKYNITEHDGTLVDGTYFILRIDKDGDDQDHINACRSAAFQYASYIHRNLDIKHPLQNIADDLIDFLAETRN